MAPKKDNKPVEEQWDGPIVFVVVTLQSLNNPLSTVPWALLPGSSQPKQFEPQTEETSSFQITFKRPQGLETLSWFLNDPLKIQLGENQDVHVDLIGLAQGESHIEQQFENDGIKVVVRCEHELPVEENGDENSQQQTNGVQLVPYKFLSDEEVQGSLIMEISNIVISSVPQGLLTAQNFCGGQLQVALAINFCEGCAIENLNGDIQEGIIKWNKKVRKYIPNHVVRQLRRQLEDSLECKLEVCRFLQTSAQQQFQDPQCGFYHALVPLNCADDLLTPGQKQFEFSVELNQQFDSAQDVSSVSLCQKPATPNPKSKIIEQAPSSEQCQWIEYNSIVNFQLNFSDSLYPPWTPPPKPTKSLQELIPYKPEPAKAAPTTEELFRAHVKQTISNLDSTLDSYVQKFGQEEPDKEKIRKKCIFELNKSGEYLRTKTGLKKYVVDMLNWSHQDIEDLYVRMYEHVQSVQCESQLESAENQNINEQESEETLRRLANECQAMQQTNRCDKIYQKILALYPRSVQTWYEYGTLNIQGGDIGKGEEALREVLAISPSHYDGLLALSCLLFHKGLFTDSLYYEECLVLLQSAQEVRSDQPIVWAMLTMVYKGLGESQYPQEIRNCTYKVKQIGKELLCQQKEGNRCNGFAMAAELFLDLNLSDCGNRAVRLATQMNELTENCQVELTILQARCENQLGNYESALNHVKKVIEEGGLQALQLRAKIHYDAKYFELAIKDYENIIKQTPDSCSCEVYQRLGLWYLSRSEGQYAHDVYANACIAYPKSSYMWLGLGRSYLILGQTNESEQCLTEANNLDIYNAEVWAYLALLNVIEDRWEEIRMSIKYAIREGLSDSKILVQIAGKLLDRGRNSQAEEVLRQALCIQNQQNEDVLNIRLMLASCLQQQNEYQFAIKQYQYILSSDPAPFGEIQAKAMSGQAAAYRAIGNVEQAEALEAEMKN